MKKTLGVLLFAIITINLHGQQAVDILAITNAYIAEKKYESAYRELDIADNNNTWPEIVLAKQELLLNYYITTNMHLTFGLRDLDSGENLAQARIKKEGLKTHNFNAEQILSTLINSKPENCLLYKGLGDYYFEVEKTFKGGWTKSPEELQVLIASNYKNAIEKRCGDYVTYYRMGYIKYKKEEYKASISDLYLAIELKNDFADAHYYIADAFQKTSETAFALQYYKNALALYQDAAKQSEIASTIGGIYLGSKSADSALVYYEIANSKMPGKIDNLKVLLDLYQKKNDKRYQKITSEIFSQAPRELDTYSLLESIYYPNLKEDEIIAFYKSQLSSSKIDNKTRGIVNLSLGKIYLDKDKKISKQYLLTAKEICKKEYTSDDRVMLVIESCMAKAEMK